MLFESCIILLSIFVIVTVDIKSLLILLEDLFHLIILLGGIVGIIC